MTTDDPDPAAVRTESYGVELAYVVLAVNVLLIFVQGIRWWNLVMVAIAVRYGTTMTVARYRVAAESGGMTDRPSTPGRQP